MSADNQKVYGSTSRICVHYALVSSSGCMVEALPPWKVDRKGDSSHYKYDDMKRYQNVALIIKLHRVGFEVCACDIKIVD